MSCQCVHLSMRFLDGYENLWQKRRGTRSADDPRCVFDLSQSPFTRPSMTSKGGSCPCVTHSFCSFWHAASARFLLPKELALGLGWPCLPALALAAGVPEDPCAEMYTTSQLGNSMHLTCVGLTMAVALTCTSRGS